MSAPTVTVRPEDVRGAHRLTIGAGLGIAGALLSLVLPVAFLWVAAYAPGGFFSLGTNLVQVIAILLLAGAILLLLCLFTYRRAFASLRAVDPRFVVASVLCIIGAIGFLLIVVSAALILNDSASLVTCIQGHPSHLLSCLRSGQPLGAYTGLAGFWLGWLGGVGLVVGLGSAARRFHRGALGGGAALYALLLLILVGPFIELIYPVPYAQGFLLVVPLFAVLAPALVWAGARRPPSTVRPA